MRDLDKYLIKYDNLPFEDIQVKYRRRRLLELLNELKPSNILEIGCGYNPLFSDYRSFKTFSVVEPIKTFYDSAKEKSYKDINIRIFNKSLEESIDELIQTNFDFIIASSILHEVKDPIDFLNCVKKISTPETKICIIVPNSHSFHRLLAVSMGLIKNEFEMSKTQIKLQQNSSFNRNNLCELLKDNGLNPYSSESYFIKPFTHQQMQNSLKKNIINNEILDGLYNLSKTFPDFGSELMVLSQLS